MQLIGMSLTVSEEHDGAVTGQGLDGEDLAGAPDGGGNVSAAHELLHVVDGGGELGLGHRGERDLNLGVLVELDEGDSRLGVGVTQTGDECACKILHGVKVVVGDAGTGVDEQDDVDALVVHRGGVGHDTCRRGEGEERGGLVRWRSGGLGGGGVVSGVGGSGPVGSCGQVRGDRVLLDEIKDGEHFALAEGEPWVVLGVTDGLLGVEVLPGAGMAGGGRKQNGVGGEVAPAGVGAAPPTDGVVCDEVAESAGDVLQGDEVCGGKVCVAHGDQLIWKGCEVEGGLVEVVLLLLLVVVEVVLEGSGCYGRHGG